ncbi:RNA polymerase sigma factor [Aquimarina sp. SS2-1]|uniref:RNA polymerase sigma factor n=1 Tax=Aquimarina besae TaxID=3342247 RepID=UPI0036726DDE
MNSIKKQQIIDGIVAGDSEILKAFYKKNLPYVKKYILKNQGTIEDVKDIFQEGLVLLYHKLRSDHLKLPVSSIHAYFIGVCKNMWRNKLRKQLKIEHQVLNKKNVIDLSDSIIESITYEHQLEIYRKHFSRLSNSSKYILDLFFEGKSMRDIANINGYSEGYTRKKKYLIKEHLNKMVQSDPIYNELVMS